MREKDIPQTFETFLREEITAEALARDIDRAMLSIVLLLKYEKEQAEALSRCYESLYGLRNVILNYKP
ncbi:MAG: hypothetical protein ACK40G_17165 [Cytophagaceae bacterium]